MGDLGNNNIIYPWSSDEESLMLCERSQSPIIYCPTNFGPLDAPGPSGQSSRSNVVRADNSRPVDGLRYWTVSNNNMQMSNIQVADTNTSLPRDLGLPKRMLKRNNDSRSTLLKNLSPLTPKRNAIMGMPELNASIRIGPPRLAYKKNCLLRRDRASRHRAVPVHSDPSSEAGNRCHRSKESQTPSSERNKRVAGSLNMAPINFGPHDFKPSTSALADDQPNNSQAQERNEQDNVDSGDVPVAMSLEEVIEVNDSIDDLAVSQNLDQIEDAGHINDSILTCTQPRPKVEDEPKTKEMNMSLLRLLECPVCLEFMEAPIAQCRRGHLVCAKCRERLNTCPVCRSLFSSVRNRAMEGVSEIVRYPCRHGCGRVLRLRRRPAHEANCSNRNYSCPIVACTETGQYKHSDILPHIKDKHLCQLKHGAQQTFSLKLNEESQVQWLVHAHGELFHVRVDVNMHTWSLHLYVAYIGPKRSARNYTYVVTVCGKYNNRKVVYSRETHSDLENTSFHVGRHDCFHLSLDQAMNYLRYKNTHLDAADDLDVKLSLTRDDSVVDANDNASDV